MPFRIQFSLLLPYVNSESMPLVWFNCWLLPLIFFVLNSATSAGLFKTTASALQINRMTISDYNTKLVRGDRAIISKLHVFT